MVYNNFKADNNDTQEAEDNFNFDVIHSKRESMAFDSIAFTRSSGSLTEDKKGMNS
jgi:hypothetical protein